jgi:hypothetical protein
MKNLKKSTPKMTQKGRFLRARCARNCALFSLEDLQEEARHALHLMNTARAQCAANPTYWGSEKEGVDVCAALNAEYARLSGACYAQCPTCAGGHGCDHCEPESRDRADYAGFCRYNYRIFK